MIGRARRKCPAWSVYLGLALACTTYFNARSALVPKWGVWYSPNRETVLQVRAFLAGRLAIVAHPSGAAHDSAWGRGGMHQAWGLGVPILATPFHLIGRVFGAPGFPDDVRFLILYAATTVALAWALHKTSRRETSALIASAAAAGFVMVFPTFVGMVSSRFMVYEQAIATGALWSVLLLSATLALAHRCTPGRLVFVCAAAGFSILIRPPLAVYGVTTLTIALILARRRGVRAPARLGGVLAYAGITGLFLVGNALRFGSPLNAGYATTLSGAFVNRLVRWGLPFSKVPFSVAAKEMFATWFLLDPVPNQIMMGAPPASVQPYIVGERWREYYAPTFDLWIFAIWMGALAIVGWRIVRGRLWKRDEDLGGEVMTIIGAWALPPAIVLFVFYARVPQLVTRYATDAYPAFAAASLCVGMAIVDAVRKHTPSLTGSARLAIAGLVALYLGGWRGWVTHLSTPIDSKATAAQIAEFEVHGSEAPVSSDHFKCNEPRGPQPVYTHLDDWQGDCFFRSGMVFAMRYSPCVSFTFGPGSNAWGVAEDESLAHFRANGDFDVLMKCGAPSVDGDTRRLTMCEPRTPTFLLDGMRLYAIATLDDNLNPIDRLKLLKIEAAPSCIGQPR